MTKFELTGNTLRRLILESLGITFSEFAVYCGKPEHSWISRQVALGTKKLTFEANARAFLGYVNYRFSRVLDNCDDLPEEDANRLKAQVFDQCCGYLNDVLGVPTRFRGQKFQDVAK